MNRKIFGMVLGILIVTSLFTGRAYADRKVTRISGANRYETAVEISAQTFTSADGAVIASGENYPDALVGGTLAIQIEGPMILVEKNRIPQQVLSELRRLKVSKVYLLGGVNAISSEVERQLDDEFDVERLAGSDRYETASIIGRKRQALLGGARTGDRKAYVNGNGFADALAASAYVGRGFGADGSIGLLDLIAPSEKVSSGLVIGGEASVKGKATDRIAGENRYATAVEVAKRHPVDLGITPKTVIVASGENFPDGLAVAPMVVHRQAVLLLSPKDSLAPETKAYLTASGIENVVLIGGEAAISNKVEREIKGEPAIPEPVKKPPSKIVFIDPGHQGKGNSDREPVGPGASEKKAKVSSGTSGVVTKRPEHELNLEVSLKLGKALEETGYEVHYGRTTANVDISNAERAKLATEKKADLFLRIHANSVNNSKKEGILMVIPTAKSPYHPELYKNNRRLAELMLKHMVDSTGAASDGIWETDTMSGNNWATMPNVLIEMGYMSNAKEDRLLSDPDYQNKLVKGMVAAVRGYFAE